MSIYGCCTLACSYIPPNTSAHWDLSSINIFLQLLNVNIHPDLLLTVREISVLVAQCRFIIFQVTRIFHCWCFRDQSERGGFRNIVVWSSDLPCTSIGKSMSTTSCILGYKTLTIGMYPLSTTTVLPIPCRVAR